MTQTACPRLGCVGVLIYRGVYYECAHCHRCYPAAMIDEMVSLPNQNVEAIPLGTLDDDTDPRDLAAIRRDVDRQMYQQIDAEDRGEFIEDWPEDA
jgi:hypothetical protein